MELLYDDAVFGQWVRRRRRALDITQKELARRVGCSAVMIRKVEHDERRPSRRVAAALGAALGVPEAEREAFVRFARAGWADDPPNGPSTPPERPWQRLQRHTDATIPPPGRPPDGTEREGEGPRVVAREAELGRLERELDRVLAGRGRTVLITGEAGQGKTALMNAFAAHAQARHPELLIAVGTCNAYTGHGDPFLPFRQILAQLTGGVPDGPRLDAFERERARRLLRSAPRTTHDLAQSGSHVLDSLLPVEPLRARLKRRGISIPPLPRAPATAYAPMPSQQAVQNNQLALRAETAAAIVATATRAPLLLLLDDLQWLDDSSAELLLHLARNARASRLLLLGACRPADEVPVAPASRALNELARSHATTLDLGGADGRAFVNAWLDRQANELDDAFRAALWRQTAGHPLFTIELTRAMQEHGDLIQGEGGVWTAAPGLRWDRLPTRIADALAAQMERLDAATMDVLRAASVEGTTFTAEVTARVLNREMHDVVRSLGVGSDRPHHLIAAVEVKRVPAGLVTRYRFRHDLIQRYVYGTIDPGERAHLHEGIASAQAALLGDDADPVALALHYTLAQAPERAARHHRKAGDRARRSHAFDRAVEHYRAALAHWPDGEPHERAALRRELGECQYLLLRRDEATRNLTQASAALEAAGDLRQAAAAQRTLALIFTTDDEFDRAFEACRRAVVMLEPLGESADLGAAMNTLSRLHMLVSQFDLALAWGERAMAMAERLGTADLQVQATIRIGSALHQVEPPRSDESVRHLKRGLRTADEKGLAYDACHAAYNLADVLETAGRLDQARASYLACIARAQSHQITNFEYYAQYALWRHDWSHGNWTEAFERVALVRRIVEGAAHADFQMSRFAFDLAACDLDLGRIAEARSTLARHQRSLSRLQRPGERLPSLGTSLRAAVAAGDPQEADRAAAAIAGAIDPAPPIEYDIMAPVLEALRYLTGKGAPDARTGATACLQALGRLQRHYASPGANAALEEARALQAAADGSTPEAAALWARAADAWQAATYPLREAHARAAAVRALRAARRDQDARTQKARAERVLARLSEQIPDEELLASFARSSRSLLAGTGSAPG